MKRLLARLVMWLIRDELRRLAHAVAVEQQKAMVHLVKSPRATEVFDESVMKEVISRVHDAKARGTW